MSYAFVRRSEQPFARLVPAGASLAFESSYDAALVAAFKAEIPYTARKWDKDNRRWLVHPQYAQTCADLALAYLGVSMAIPAARSAAVGPETRLLKLDYLGRCKERESGESLAYGWVDGDWKLIVNEAALRQWFDAPKSPSQESTLYQVLAVKQGATADEIKSAHRRMARQWHPDVCKEPDAGEQFKKIQAAWEVLGEPLKRKKYDAGLYLEAAAKRGEPAPRSDDYRYDMDGNVYNASGYAPPFRCGWLLCEGIESLGRFVVGRILQWEDVTDGLGRTMVTSWPKGAEQFRTDWV